MPKFESPIAASSLKGKNSNTVIIHLGDDNRVGIGTTAPETKLHVNGAITATGLVVPPGTLATAIDVADFWGFNPKFDDWVVDANGKDVAEGWTHTGSGSVVKSEHHVLGSYSAKFDGGQDVVWSREIEFPEPLYANVFLQGSYSYQYADYTSGEPGFAITLHHREATNSDIDPGTQRWSTESSNTFIAPTLGDASTRGSASSLGNWQASNWRVTTPGNREITKFKIEILSGSTKTYDSDAADVHLSAGGGVATEIGGSGEYTWHLDGLSFSFMHPDMRIDQEGRITGTYLAYASITDAHIKNMISSHSAKIIYPDSGTQDGFTESSLYGHVVEGLVANGSYASGWSIDKSGKIKAKEITIYNSVGKPIFTSGGFDSDNGPNGPWTLGDLDPGASNYLYNLSFEESNSTKLQANIGFLATSGQTSNTIVADANAIYFSENARLGPWVNHGGSLSNGSITFNGLTTNAPPGSYTTGGDLTVKNADAYILFLANTAKWSYDGANAAYYNSDLGGYGVYTIGMPTRAGWIYHPSANDTWQDFQPEFTESDFLVIGRIKTGADAQISQDGTYPDSPKHPDSITEIAGLGEVTVPYGISSGGILFADLKANQKNHASVNGWIQFTNPRNNPNTNFVFIHPTGFSGPDGSGATKARYVVNGHYGVSVKSLESIPGERHIVFTGAGDNGRFVNLDPDNSPDFISAFPLGISPIKWYYDQTGGTFSEFTPGANDSIVATVFNNDASQHPPIDFTQIHYQREAETSEGAVLSDMILDPPIGMPSGGILFASMNLNSEWNGTAFVANDGFIALTNEANPTKDEFFAIHPDNNFYRFEAKDVNRGVVTSINQSRPGGSKTGIRHIAFVGQDSTRFTFAAGYDDVSNDFVAVTKYNAEGGIASDGEWYYDNGVDINSTFPINANDFIVATVASYSEGSNGVDQIKRYASREAVTSEGITIDSFHTLVYGPGGLEDYADEIYQRANDAFQTAIDARDNVAFLYGLEDNQIKSYFDVEGANPEGSAGVLANNESHTDFNFNDIWINTSIYNRHIDGSWSPNAIFRYANSDLGFQGDLKWMHDRENPVGRTYIATLEFRDLSDRNSTTFYADMVGESGVDTYDGIGPNVAFTAVNSTALAVIPNRKPSGDIWIDTKLNTNNEPRNHKYIYRTNTAWHREQDASPSGYIFPGNGGANNWSQNVHSGVFDPVDGGANNLTGWWGIRDETVFSANDPTARTLARNANTTAQTALQAAADALIAADGEILAFFEDSTFTPVPNASGNGDIWIHTDNVVDSVGRANLDSIHVSNSVAGLSGISSQDGRHTWVSSPNNGIGKMYLESYSSGVTGEFQRGDNIMPRGTSLWDQPAGDYLIYSYNKTYPGTDPADNLKLSPYQIGYAHITYWGDEMTDVSIDSSGGANAWYGSNSLKVEMSDGPPSDTRQYVILTGTAIPYGEAQAAKSANTIIKIPKGKRWVFSYYTKSNYANTTHPARSRVKIIGANTGNYLAGGIIPYADGESMTDPGLEITTPDTWHRDSVVIDLTTSDPTVQWDNSDAYGSPLNEITDLHIFIGGTPRKDPVDQPHFYWFDAIQLEEVANNVGTPSQFKEPSDGSAIIQGRRIVDGKIYNHFGPQFDPAPYYGPEPQFTPKERRPNPYPHGDRWVNTSNNRLEFVYHQNSSNHTAQTIFWHPVVGVTLTDTHPSGWYSTEDERTANALGTSYTALEDAATSQAAADREILAFFETGNPIKSTGVGDIWIDIDKYASLRKDSIYVSSTDSASGLVANNTTYPLWWKSAPESAVGQTYLEAFLAGDRASRSESLAITIAGGADLPFPIYPDHANGIIGVGATGNVVFTKNTPNPSDILVENYGGIDFIGPGGNIWHSMTTDYGIPTGSTHVNTRYEGGNLTLESDANGSGGTGNVAFLMYSNQNAAVRFGDMFGDNHHFVPVTWKESEETWKAIDPSTTEIPFIPDSANGDFLVAQIERKFAETNPVGIHRLESWVFKNLPVQIKSMSDGKIVTYYSNNFSGNGPSPNTTPQGLANPEPYGDLWVDTGNNNLVFLYFSNATNKSSQTAYHAPRSTVGHGDMAGWFSTEDDRVVNAHTWAYSGFQAAVGAQSTADHEIVSFYNVEDASIGFSRANAQGHDTAGYGDIWIDFSEHNRNTDGSLKANAINRYQNTSFGASPSTGNLVWESAENNAIGKVFLDAYLAKNLADAATITYYVDNFNGFGPNTYTTPSGHINENPHGDFWVDTGNNNILFTYNLKPGDPLPASNLAFYGIKPADNSNLSGWYCIENTLIYEHDQTLTTHGEDIQTALYDAANAQSAADREILAFFNVSTDRPTTASGNGDVWIQTDYATGQDGDVNTNAIFVANTKTTGHIGSAGSSLFWHQSPENAIGRGFIEQFASVGVKNWMPSPYSLFDEDPEEYDGRDSGFTTTKPYPIASSPVGQSSTISIDTSGGANAYIGSTSLKLGVNNPGTTTSRYFGFANSFNENVFPSKYSIKIPKGRRWIFSAWAKGDATDGTYEFGGFTGRLYLEGANSTHGYSGQINKDGLNGGSFTLASIAEPLVYPPNTWRRVFAVLDLSSGMSSDAGELNQWDEVIPGIALMTSNGEERTAWFDAIQLEEAPGARVLPGQFSDPDKQISDDFARALSDGKILTHYEPAIDSLKAWWRMDSADAITGDIPNVVSPGTYDANTFDGLPSFADDTIFSSPAVRKSFINLTSPKPNGNGIILLANSVASAMSKATYTLWMKPTGNTTAGGPPPTGFSPHIIGRGFGGHWSVHSETGHTFVDDGATYGELNFWASGNKRILHEPGQPNSGEGVLLDGKWNFIATTVDHTTRELKIYVYNEKDGFVTQNTHTALLNADSAASLADYTGDVTLGVDAKRQLDSGYGPGADYNTRPEANFDHVRVYDRVLSKYDIDTLFALRNRALKQPVIDLYPEWYANNIVYGPDPEYTPKGRLPNDAPHGDYWIDTSDGNRQFRYNQNTTNKIAQTAYYTTIAYQEDKLGYEPSGWFSVSDGTIGIISDDLEQVFVDLTEAQDAADKANALLDGEIKIFFENENATLGFANGAQNNSALFGDIWINTSHYNFEDLSGVGSPLTNAIFRYQNTSYGITDPLSPGWTANGDLVWEPAPNNAIGKVYLDAWEARDHADHSATIYTVDNFSGYGPNPQVTPTGLINVKPDGDLWFDTGNNDLQFVYYANATYTFTADYSNDPIAQTAWYQTRPGDNQYQVGWYNFTPPDSWDTNHKTFRVISQGWNSFQYGQENYSTIAPFQTLAAPGGPADSVLGIYPEGATNKNERITGGPGVRSYNLVVWDRETGEFRTSGVCTNADDTYPLTGGVAGNHYRYDVNFSSSNAASLATDLNELSSNSMIILWTADEPKQNRFGPGNVLLDAMKKCGAANVVFGAGGNDGAWNVETPGFKGRSAYILIGIPNQGEGSGVEFYSGDVNSSNNAWTEASITFLSKSHAMISGSSSHGLMTEENINQLQIDVLRAQASADREINSFFALASNVPTATGNGDIWIQTDAPVNTNGTANTDAIFVANTLNTTIPAGGSPAMGWHNSPDNALGRSYLQSYADSISGEFDGGINIMPRGISLWDASITDYKITDGASADTVPPEVYGITSQISQFANVAIERGFGSNSYLNESSLRVEGGSGYIAFVPGNEWNSQARAENNQKYRINIPKGKRWIFSYYVRANTTGMSVYPWFYSSNSTHYNSGNAHENLYSSAKQSVSTTDTWERHEWVFDFTISDLITSAQGGGPHNEVTSISPVLQLTSPGSGADYYFDAFQLEEVPAHRNTATPFKTPDIATSLDFTRAIADGKIVEFHMDHAGTGAVGDYWGPDPTTTEQGLPNPTPYGDKWFDTANNNVEFWYFANNSVKNAQTAYWTSGPAGTNLSGWYSLEDPRVSQKNSSYRTSGALPSAPYQIGDLWTNTSTGKLYICVFSRDVGGTPNATDWELPPGTPQIFAQGTMPSIGDRGANANTTGDLWFDTLDDNKLYRWNISDQWVRVDDGRIGQSVSDILDRTRVFRDGTEPVGPALVDGDLWFDTTNKVWSVHDGSNWVSGQDADLIGRLLRMNLLGQGAKQNFRTWETGAAGDIYFHGFDDNGNANNVEGFWIDGTTKKYTATGPINPQNNDPRDWYIMYTPTDSTVKGSANGEWWAVDYEATGGTWGAADSELVWKRSNQRANEFSPPTSTAIHTFPNTTPTTSDMFFGKFTHTVGVIDNVTMWGSPKTFDEFRETANAAMALQNAARSQAAADGEVQVFYKTSAPLAGEPDNRSYGDIWIDTDEQTHPTPLTTAAIHRYQKADGATQDDRSDAGAGNGWRKTPNDPFGQNALRGAHAQATADGKMTIHTGSWIDLTNENTHELGDFFVVTDAANEATYYATSVSTGQGSWEIVRDSLIHTKGQIFNVSGGGTTKTKITGSGPTPPYYVDDVWADSNSAKYGTVVPRICVDANTTGYYFDDWVSYGVSTAEVSGAPTNTGDNVHSFWWSSGDFWIDTSDNNNTYTFDGSAWNHHSSGAQGILLGTDRIDPGALDGVPLDEGTIQGTPVPDITLIDTILDAGVDNETINQQILLNPVQPSRANLHGHWAFNSFAEDGGVRYVVDKSGRNNHALVHYDRFTDGQSVFREDNPGSGIINISGDNSLYSAGSGNTNSGGIVIGVHGSGSQTNLSDGPSPLDISDNDLYSQQTFTWWFKPGDTPVAGDIIIDRDITDWWGVSITDTGYNANNEVRATWYMGAEFEGQVWNQSTNREHIDFNSEGWVGPAGRRALQKNKWHFMVLQNDYAGATQYTRLWIFREGEGLLYTYKLGLAPGSNTEIFMLAPSSGGQMAVKFFENSESADGAGTFSNRVNGYLDEARFYGEILTPRNINWLFEHPSGIDFTTPQHKLGVKKGYYTFNIPTSAGEGNTSAYVHGFDQDGNAADVPGEIVVDTGVVSVSVGHANVALTTGNWATRSANNGFLLTRKDGALHNSQQHFFAQPIKTTIGTGHTWQYINSTSKFEKTSFGDENFMVIGDVSLQNNAPSGLAPNQDKVQIDSIQVYDAARVPSVIREGFRLDAELDDVAFTELLTGSGWSNTQIESFLNQWAIADSRFTSASFGSSFTLHAQIVDAMIGSLTAAKITTGTLDAATTITLGSNDIQLSAPNKQITIGSDGKIVLDGTNKRIIIKD